MTTLNIAGLTATIFPGADAQKVIYILYPTNADTDYFTQKASEIGHPIVMIEGMDWDNDLTPWPAPGEPQGCAPFKGLAPEFLKKLQEQVLPAIEGALKATNPERTLLGVSLSGLFALWQWTQCSTFKNIISLSGSFWYEGFVHWFENETLPSGKGQAYFSLGNLEPQNKVPAFRRVGVCTEQVIARLQHAGIPVVFQWEEGTHFAPIKPRLDHAFAWFCQKFASVKSANVDKM